MVEANLLQATQSQGLGLAQLGALILGVVSLAVIATLIAFRRRLGPLKAASWLVVLGALIIGGEHVNFGISYSVPLITNEGPMTILPHARVHFFMASIYALVGLVMLSVVAMTLLREGRKAGWYAILFALLFGGGFDILAGAFFFSHGFPLYEALTGVPVQGFGWEALYTYFLAWGSALVISYRPVFGGSRNQAPLAEKSAPNPSQLLSQRKTNHPYTNRFKFDVA